MKKLKRKKIVSFDWVDIYDPKPYYFLVCYTQRNLSCELFEKKNIFKK